MINSRYTIEYIEAESEKKKSSGFRSFFTFIFSTLVLSALGLFAYVAITGNTLPNLIQEPITLAQNYIKKSILLPTSQQETSDTENVDIIEESSEIVGSTDKDSELIAQQEQILSLLAEKEKIINELKILKQASIDKAKTYQQQLTTNKAITAQFDEVKKQLKNEKGKSLSLSEQFKAQQVENQTLATLLKEALKKSEKDSKHQVSSVEKQDETLEVKEEATKIQETKNVAKSKENILQKNSITETLPTPVSKPLEKVVSIETEEESPPSDQEENQTELTAPIKTDDLTTDSKKTETSSTPEESNKSAVDAIIEAMEKAQSSN